MKKLLFSICIASQTVLGEDEPTIDFVNEMPDGSIQFDPENEDMQKYIELAQQKMEFEKSKGDTEKPERPAYQDSGEDDGDLKHFNYDDLDELTDNYYRHFGGGLDVPEDDDMIEAVIGLEDLKQDEIDYDALDGETSAFKAETNRLMDILVNSLYSNEEVFIRELISNAVDAIEKQRVVELTDEGTKESELAIYIESSKPAIGEEGDHIVVVQDTGVGMSKDELITNLGTVAKSGTKAFQEAIQQGGVGNLIGQFGVGFYSSFLVADIVTVVSKADGHDQHIWKSSADGKFTVYKDPRGNTLKRGTRIELKLKPQLSKYADFQVLRKTIVQMSEFVEYPIFIKRTKDDEVKWIHVNPGKPIWQRPRSQVTEEEHTKFYKKITGDTKKPLAYTHYSGEGEIEFKAVLYIPNKEDENMLKGDFEEGGSVKLYSRNVLISHETGLLPQYLSFVVGVVESNDLPLKVDRESLANSKSLKIIKRKLHKKVLDMMKNIKKDHVKEWKAYNLAKDNGEDAVEPKETHYDTLMNYYINHIFMGCASEGEIKFKYSLMEIPRFKHTKDKGFIDLVEYIQPLQDRDSSNNKESTNKIFYGWAQSVEQILANPVAEQYEKLGADIILVENSLADNCMMRLTDFRGIKPQSYEKNIDPTIDKKSRMMKAQRKHFKPFFKAVDAKIKEVYQAYGDSAPTSLLTRSPSAIFIGDMGLTGSQERHVRSQHWYSSDLDWRFSNKKMSINLSHPYVKKLYKLFEEDPESDMFKKGSLRLYDFAVLAGNHFVERHDRIASIINESMNNLLEIKDLEDHSLPYIPDEVFDEVDEQIAKADKPIAEQNDESEYQDDDTDDEEEQNDEEEDPKEDDTNEKDEL